MAPDDKQDRYDQLAADVVKANERFILATVKVAHYQYGPSADTPTAQEQVLLDEFLRTDRELRQAIANALRGAAAR
jgi:hypothetical protein